MKNRYFYKIRHKPTGLFYAPSRGYQCSNFSKQGKIYNKKPTLKYLLSHLYVGHNINKEFEIFNCKSYQRDYPFKKIEWEIVKFEVKEIEVLNE